MQRCEECDLTFGRVYNLQRHMEKFHPQSEEEEEEEVDSDDEGSETSEEEEEEGEEEHEEEEGDDDIVHITPMWERLRYRAMKTVPHDQAVRFEERKQELIADGATEEKASRMATSEISDAITTNLYKLFRRKVEEMEELTRDPVYKQIKETRKRSIDEEDFEPDEALYHAIDKRKFLIQKAAGLLDVSDEGEEDVDEEEEDDDEH